MCTDLELQVLVIFNNDITQINIYIKRLQNYLNLC